jgi:tRNA U34 5-carboxymethylaminomethyl modifying GTPase MnmE/TrmE
MTLPKWHKKIYDASTGVETIIDFTPEEVVIAEAQQAEFLAEIAKKEIEKTAKDAEKQAILDRLGITAEEAALLLG